MYSLTKLQQYILRIVKAVYLGAEYLILSDVVRLHYDADFSLLRDLVRTLLEHQISILLTDSYQNPLFICSDACRILRFEGGMLLDCLMGRRISTYTTVIVHMIQAHMLVFILKKMYPSRLTFHQ